MISAVEQWVQRRSIPIRLAGTIVLVIAMLCGPVGAQDDGGVPEGVQLQISALAAVDFDPWQLQDDEIEGRRVPVAEYEAHTRGVAEATVAARVEVERELADAEEVLDAVRDHRADMEEEVEGYSISMWVLGDLGLQEMYGSDAERARQEQPVVAVTESLIARVEAADAAIADAEADVEAISIVLAERVAADDVAQRTHRNATQIHDRLETMISARNEAIDRLTHELLTEERPEVDLVTITSVTVQVPIGLPDDRGAAAASSGEGVAGRVSSGRAVTDGSDTPAEAAPVPTEGDHGGDSSDRRERTDRRTGAGIDRSGPFRWHRSPRRRLSASRGPDHAPYRSLRHQWLRHLRTSCR